MSCSRSIRARFFRSIMILCGLAFLACTSLPRHPRPRDFEGVGDGFSGELVEAHLAALWSLGERSPGSESDEISRAYLVREFRLSGAKSAHLAGGGAGGGDLEHLIFDLPGESPDVVLLVAAYPVLGSGKEVDETGAAVLVELARVFGSRDQPPYTLRFALADTRPATAASTTAPTARRSPPVAESDHSSSEAREASEVANTREALLIEAGRELARALEVSGQSERVRAIIVLDLSFHSNLVVARDLRSHPGFRDIFWASAARLGFEAIFPPDADWASPATLQLGFREERAVDRIVALVEAAPAPGRRDLGVSERAFDREETIRTFDSLGQVVVDALGRLMERLQKVDAFSR